MPVRKSVPVAKKNASNAVHDKRTFKNGSEAYEQDLEADLKSVREQIRELRQLDEKKNQLFEALTEKTLDALTLLSWYDLKDSREKDYLFVSPRALRGRIWSGMESIISKAQCDELFPKYLECRRSLRNNLRTNIPQLHGKRHNIHEALESVLRHIVKPFILHNCLTDISLELSPLDQFQTFVYRIPYECRAYCLYKVTSMTCNGEQAKAWSTLRDSLRGERRTEGKAREEKDDEEDDEDYYDKEGDSDEEEEDDDDEEEDGNEDEKDNGEEANDSEDDLDRSGYMDDELDQSDDYSSESHPKTRSRRTSTEEDSLEEYLPPRAKKPMTRLE